MIVPLTTVSVVIYVERCCAEELISVKAFEDYGIFGKIALTLRSYVALVNVLDYLENELG